MTKPHRGPSVGGYRDPNWPSPLGPHDADIIIYGYLPSFALALLGIILFSLSFVVHTFQLRRYRTWYFTPVAVGTVLEVVGYIFRALSAKLDPYSIIYFVVQYFFIVLAPVLFSAGIYTILSALIKRTGNGSTEKGGRRFSPLGPRVILYIFIACDIIATIIQATGAAFFGVRESNGQDPTKPNNVVIGGLAFQVFTFLVYILLTITYMWRARHVLFRRARSSGKTDHDFKTEGASGSGSGAFPTGRAAAGDTHVSKKFLVAFMVATLAVYMRTCYRLAETAKAQYGTKANQVHEVYFGALEFAPVVVCVLLLNIWHPGRYLRTD